MSSKGIFWSVSLLAETVGESSCTRKSVHWPMAMTNTMIVGNSIRGSDRARSKYDQPGYPNRKNKTGADTGFPEGGGGR